MEAGSLAPYAFKLADRDVHIWPVRIESSDAVMDRLRTVLDPEEAARCARFRLEELRRSFAIFRGAFRILLGRYLNIAPADIRFRYGPTGKPSLFNPTEIRFNASRSGGLALFAFTTGCEIGVDIEQIRPLQNLQEIASRFFCSEEAAELMSLPHDAREGAFFLCWTRKEAYIKALGEGLSAELSEFQVTLGPGEPARFIHLAHDPVAAKAWTLHDLKLADTHAGALAYRDTPRPLHVLPLIDPAQLLDVE